MNLFKKKYKRSEWFEGLLEAEKLFQDGYVYDRSTSNYLYFQKLPYNTIGIPNKGMRAIGVMDYLNHREEYKNIFNRY